MMDGEAVGGSPCRLNSEGERGREVGLSGGWDLGFGIGLGLGYSQRGMNECIPGLFFSWIRIFSFSFHLSQ